MGDPFYDSYSDIHKQQETWYERQLRMNRLQSGSHFSLTLTSEFSRIVNQRGLSRIYSELSSYLMQTGISGSGGDRVNIAITPDSNFSDARYRLDIYNYYGNSNRLMEVVARFQQLLCERLGYETRHHHLYPVAVSEAVSAPESPKKKHTVRVTVEEDVKINIVKSKRIEL